MNLDDEICGRWADSFPIFEAVRPALWQLAWSSAKVTAPAWLVSCWLPGAVVTKNGSSNAFTRSSWKSLAPRQSSNLQNPPC